MWKKVITIIMILFLTGGVCAGIGCSESGSNVGAIATRPTDLNDPTQAPSVQQAQPNQPSQEPSAEIFEVLASDELVLKIYQCKRDRMAGKNGTELEKWLLSLEGQRIRLTGKIHDLVEWDENRFNICMGKSINGFPIALTISGDMPHIKLAVGNEITIEGIVESIYPNRSSAQDAARVRLERILE